MIRHTLFGFLLIGMLGGGLCFTGRFTVDASDNGGLWLRGGAAQVADHRSLHSTR